MIPQKLWTEKVTVHRDRENSTVFVADLPHGVTDDDLKQLFKDVRMLAQFICQIVIFFFAQSVVAFAKSKLPNYPDH